LANVDVDPHLEKVVVYLRDHTPEGTVLMTDVPSILAPLSGRRCIPFVYAMNPPRDGRRRPRLLLAGAAGRDRRHGCLGVAASGLRLGQIDLGDRVVTPTVFSRGPDVGAVLAAWSRRARGADRRRPARRRGRAAACAGALLADRLQSRRRAASRDGLARRSVRLSHAAACLLFGHRVRRLTLYAPGPADGPAELGAARLGQRSAASTSRRGASSSGSRRCSAAPRCCCC
jgi:hypothetical protein